MSFLQASNSIDETVTVGSAFTFDTEDQLVGSDISLAGTGIFTLQPGTYLIAACIQGKPTVAYAGAIKLYDVTGTAAAVLGAEARIFNATAGNVNGGSQLLQRVVSITVATSYEVRLDSATASLITRNEACHLSVIKLDALADANHLTCVRGTNQSMTTDQEVVVWNTLSDSNGSNISLNTGTGQVTVAAGTYIFFCTIDFESAAGAGRFFILYDQTGTAAVPGAEILPWNAVGAAGVCGDSTLIRAVQVSSSTTYEIRLNHTAAVTVRSGGSQLNILRII